MAADDTHILPCYGADWARAVGTKRLRGADYAHAVTTLDVVVEGRRFCLHTLPVFWFTPKPGVLEALLEWVSG